MRCSGRSRYPTTTIGRKRPAIPVSARVGALFAPAVHDLYAVFYLSPVGAFEAALEQQAEAIAPDPLQVLWRLRQLTLLIFAGNV